MKPITLLFALVCTLLPGVSGAQTITVATEAELRSAIATAPSGATIAFSADITLTADLPSIGSNLVIDGSGHTLSGGNLYRGLLVGAIIDTASFPIDVTIQNITITNTLAQGGSGGSGSSGGGGGAGLGGALFVATEANVTLKDVSFTGNQAIGGNGGTVDATVLNAAGGGGGLGGDGANGISGSAGGGGGVGVGASGGTNAAGSTGILITADPGGSSGILPGGLNGGGGAASGQGAGGGGDAGGGGFSGTAGSGGYGGGGGGGQGGLDGGTGGLGGGGGGGGSVFGFGGYGGGGGGNNRGAAGSLGGFGGGDGGGNAAPGGGGGAGMGGAIFVESGGTITISGSVSINGNTVGAGTGSGGGTNGSAYGAGMFIGGGTVIFTNAAGQTTTIADTIGDEFGSSGITDVRSASLRKTGAGTLVLTGANQLTGATFIDGGTVRVNGAGALGTGSVFIADSARLAVTASTTMAQGINVQGKTAIDAAAGQTVALNGPIQDTFAASVPVAGAIAFGGGGTISLGNTTNSYSGGSSIAGNTTVVIGADGALGQAGTAVGLGDGTSSGTLSYTSGSFITTNRGVAINAGGGAVNTAGTANVTLSTGLSGSGTFTKTGTGTLVLGGTTSHTGNNVIVDGTLRAGTAGAISSGAMQIGATAILDLNSFGQAVGSLAGGGQVSLGAATLTVGQDNTSTTYTGSIIGGISGGLVKTGTGVLTLAGTNNYGGGTTVSSGTLAGTTNSLQGNILNFGTVVFDQAGVGTYAGSMTGAGNFIKDGTGTVTLSGTNSYLGGTAVNAGRLVGTTTSLQGNIGNNGVVQFDQAGNGFYTGSMSGAGALVKSGAGTVTLAGVNSYTGGTLISGGTLAGNTASLQGTIQNDAALVFDQFTDGTYGGSLFGTGSVTKNGSGVLTLTGVSAYTGGTTINGGGIIGSTQNIQGDVTNNGFLRFDQLTDGTFTGDISGSGGLVKAGAGVVTLNGTNTYTGGTSVQSGGLIGTTSSLQGSISNSGQVTLNQDTNALLTANIFGTGSFVKAGTGIVTLTAPQTHTGGTFIIGGGLEGNTTTFTGSIVTQGSGRVIFNQTFDGTFAGSFGGTGGLTKTGGGTLTLTGTGANTGGTIIAAGGLVGNTSNIQGPVANNGTLTLNQNFTGLFNSDMSGSGSFVKAGSGTIFLTGNNSYSGGTSVLGGALVGTSSSLQGNILNNAQVIFDQSLNGTFAGSMSGTGSLTKSGSGTLALTGVNSYAGGTLITGGGGVSISNDASLGAAAAGVLLGDAASTGSLTFTNTSLLSSARQIALGAGGGIFDTAGAQVTLLGALSGAGGLVKNGSGVLQLAGSASYAGPTIVNAGTLLAGTSGAFGAGSLLLDSGTTVDLNGFNQTIGSIGGSGNLLLGNGTLTTGTDGSNAQFSGVISGSGSLVKTGGGTLVLTAANTYSGGTSVLGGALFGNTSSVQGNILNNGLVLFDQNNNGTFAGSMSGSGVLAKAGSGVLTLTGSNSYSGGTLISGGSVIGTASSLRGTIVNNGHLTFGGAGTGVFAGSITGTGTLLKTGTGTLTLNGAQPLSGLLTIDQGTLALNGSYGGSIDVLAGSTLRANGFIAGSLNLSGSLFAVAPGTAFAASSLQGTAFASVGGDSLEGPSYLSIGQNLTAASGSLLNFEVGAGINSTILVGGTASLNGARFNVTAPSIGTQRSASFLALAALNGLSVTNSDVTTGDAGVLPSLTQNREALYITLLNLNVPLASVSGPRLSGVADAIDRGKFGATGDATFVVKELTALDDGKLRDALQQLAGELHASVLQTAIVDSEAVTDLIRDQLQARQAEDVEDVRWWGETACQRADFTPKNGARGGHSNICAGAGGVDRNLSEKWTVGGGGSYTGGNMGVDGSGSGDYKAPRAFGYAGYKPRTFGFRGGGSASKSNYNTERRIDFQALLPLALGGQPLSEGVHRTAESEQDGSSGDAWSEIHDSRKISEYTVEGMVGVRRARIARSAFTESGAISVDLTGEDEVINLTQTDFKAHAFRRVGTWRPFFDFFYRHELAATETRAAVRFDAMPSSDFIVTGVNIPASTYSTKLGLSFATFLGQATFTYEYRKASEQKRQTAGFRIRFK